MNIQSMASFFSPCLPGSFLHLNENKLIIVFGKQSNLLMLWNVQKEIFVPSSGNESGGAESTV